jgi:hypothetical protein
MHFSDKLLEHLVPESVAQDIEDLKRAARLVRWDKETINVQPAGQLLPAKTRTVDEWLALPRKIHQHMVQAELALSQELNATYYPPSQDGEFLGGRLHQFGESAADLISTFSHERSALITAAQRLIRPSKIELSPPLILAYALASASSFRGFLYVIRDLRNDSGIKNLRKLMTELSVAEIPDQIEIVKTIRTQLRRILGVKASQSIDAAEIIELIPIIS